MKIAFKKFSYHLCRRFSRGTGCLCPAFTKSTIRFGNYFRYRESFRNVATQLHKILPRHTKMPVELITERLDIQPNHVFVIPENRDLHILDGEFRLKPISKPWGLPNVITVFLSSLTKHWKGKIIAVIVSGYGGDGAESLSGIKEVGGITIAQKPSTAEHPDMPESAIASGFIDFILSPEDIAKEIIRIVNYGKR